MPIWAITNYAAHNAYMSYCKFRENNLGKKKWLQILKRYKLWLDIYCLLTECVIYKMTFNIRNLTSSMPTSLLNGRVYNLWCLYNDFDFRIYFDWVEEIIIWKACLPDICALYRSSKGRHRVTAICRRKTI